MVRATVAEMLKLWNGVYPTGIDATSAGNHLTNADTWLDAYTHPDTLSTTDAGPILVANMIACQLALHGVWDHSGGKESGIAEPIILTAQIKELIDILQTDTTYDGATAIDMLDNEA